jgi:transcriptional regulator with XRE-family HTH domain
MPEADERQIGRRIAELRERRGWSQRAFAKVLGMNQSILSRIESGKRRVSASELERLAAALGVDLHVLLSGAEAPRSAKLRRPRPALRSPATPAEPCDEAPRAEEAAYLRAQRGVRALSRDAAIQEPDDEPNTPAGDPARLVGEPRRQMHRAEMPMARAPSPPRFAAGGAGAAATEGLDAAAAENAGPAEAGYAGGPLAATPVPPRRLLPPPAHTVIDDYLRLRGLTYEDDRLWSSLPPSSDALGRRRSASAAPWSLAAHMGVSESRDRYARFLRHELGIGVDGPVPDLVALFEDARVAEVVVARLSGETPVAVGATADDVAFVFVNAARPVTLQRFALVHSAAHLVLGHGDVVDERIAWSRAEPLESEANDFAEEFLAPVIAVARWYERHGDPRPSVGVLLDLAAAFGITPWSALYRSRAAERLNPKLQSTLARELRAREWSLLSEQALRGGLRDTLSSLSDEAPPPLPGARGVGGVPAPAHLRREPGPAAVLRVPARMHAWALTAVREGRLSLEQAARMLHRPPGDLAAALERLGVE